jgi:hypothetical protein
MKFLNIFCYIALSIMALNSASASTLDFTEIGSTGAIGSKTVNLSNAKLTSFGDGFFIVPPGVYGEANNLGIACADVADKACEADWQIDFSNTVKNLMMSSFATDPGDNVKVSAFLNGGIRGSVIVATDTLVDLSSFGAIDRLLIKDSSTGAGIAFGDFSFSTTVVPVPAAIWLFISSLAALISVKKGHRSRYLRKH